MADTIEKVKILDDVIAVNSKVRFGVMIGGQNVTSQPFKAISSSASNMVFNIVVPSVETIADRHLLMQATVLLRIDVQNAIAGTHPSTTASPMLWHLSHLTSSSKTYNAA
jgi:hypothetical protein